MNVYWRYVRRGQNLILANEEGQEERIGGFRETRRSIDAYATTFGYEPDRSQKGFPSVEDAKAFVESFRPWELYAVHEVTVEPEVRPAAEPTASISTEIPETLDDPSVAESKPDPPASIPEPDSKDSDLPPNHRWWEFWRRN